MKHPRVFRCTCGHRIRFGAEACGACYERAPLFNRASTLGMTAIILVLGGITAVQLAGR